MSSRNPPPWRNERERHAQRVAPSSTVPAKRSADTRAHDHPAKRSTNAAEEAWVADEDRFVLQQAKKKAALRVKGGRAKPIDWLAVTLRFVDPTKTIHDEEVGDHELEVADPEGVLEGLGEEELAELEKEIENYLTLETNKSNREYWSVSQIATRCRHQADPGRPSKSSARTRVASHDLLPLRRAVPAQSHQTSTDCWRQNHTRSSRPSKFKSRGSSTRMSPLITTTGNSYCGTCACGRPRPSCVASRRTLSRSDFKLSVMNKQRPLHRCSKEYTTC